MIFQTNTPLVDPVRVPTASTSDQGYYFAVHWPGRSVEEFGDPKHYAEEAPPTMVLFTSGVPELLVDGQTFIADFFIADPSGDLLDINEHVEVVVFRDSDGALHPDALVFPPLGSVMGGHMRLEITVESMTEHEGYALGLSFTGLTPQLGVAESAARIVARQSQASDGFLRTAFNLGPAPLDSPTRKALRASLDQRRETNRDPIGEWRYPLAGNGHRVSGTFGEWRGRANRDVHRGLDLAAIANTTVLASRGGVVSRRGTLPNQGDYLVIDHGDGWFSRYLHLDAALIQVREGESVGRGATLARGLYARTGWPVHLHFEIRHGSGQAQWQHGLPGSAQDPLQTPGIFPVPAGAEPPWLEEFGLTREHPGRTSFVRSLPDLKATGPVYVFTRFVDFEAPDRLAPRTIQFRGEGMEQPLEIRTTNESAISALLPPGALSDRGFARYSAIHAANPDRNNYYHYWWRWETSGYNLERRGPRTLQFSGEDHSQTTASFSFVFGPEVVGNRIMAVSGPPDREFELRIRAHLGANSSGPSGNPSRFAQPDRYKLEVVDSDGKPLDDVAWTGTSLNGHTHVFRTHLEESPFAFVLSEGTPPERLRLRVSSVLVPDIAHEVLLIKPPAPSRVSITIHSFAGTTWDGVAPPITISGVVNPGVEGRAEFGGSNGKQERGAPPFSGMVEQGATFYVCDEVRDFPSPPGGPFVNRTGASSFIAVSADGERRWANLSAGAWRISGGIVSDWEYQLRYSSGDGTNEHPGRLEIGTVPNSNFFSGQEITDYEVVFEP